MIDTRGRGTAGAVASGSTLTAGDMARALLHGSGMSFLERRFGWFGPLTEDEHAVLAGIVEDRVDVSQRDPIYARDDAADAPLVVLGGCLREFSIDSDGRVQVVAVRLPGDIVGTDALWAARHGFDLDALTQARVAPATALFHDPRARRLRDVARGLFLAEEAALKDRLHLLGRARAEQRLLHLLLDLNVRQKRVLDGVGDRVWLPFSQTEVGNATGLTNVYVSKTMTRLRARGTISVEGDIVTLGDPDAVGIDVDYVDHFQRAMDAAGRGGFA